MIIGYVNEKAGVVDPKGNIVKTLLLPEKAVLRYWNFTVWSYHGWANTYGGAGLEMVNSEILFSDRKIMIFGDINPFHVFQSLNVYFLIPGGNVYFIIKSFLRALKERKLKRDGYRHYTEFSTSEIAHVKSHRSGYTIFVCPEVGGLYQIGFPMKNSELREYLREYKMDRTEWEKQCKYMIKTKKREK